MCTLEEVVYFCLFLVYDGVRVCGVCLAWMGGRLGAFLWPPDHNDAHFEL